MARSKNILASGHMIMYAKEIGHGHFPGSNGWFHRWLTRYNVHLRSLSEEAAAVDTTVV